MSTLDEQQFCLRWNNFQANFTSQFETLRDDEDFTDVTIACEGQKLKAHKVVLSACSPFFKDLFKTNPCSHPIIFMKDVEAQHIVALMEFMYAGEVNVAQAHLSSFLKTAESLKIRGLTDTSSDLNIPKECSNQNSSKINAKLKSNKNASWSTVTSSQDESKECSPCSTPPSKKQCTSDSEFSRLKSIKEEPNVGINSNSKESSNSIKPSIELKMELPDYLSEEEEIIEATDVDGQFFAGPELGNLPGGMEIIPKNNHFNFKGVTHESTLQRKFNQSLPLMETDFFTNGEFSVWKEGIKNCRLIKIAEGVEITEDQLRNLKWDDYRKLTRGLATVLFSPAELATCSVTGQRWSRAGNGERPVKPALNKTKVQAIISYVATKFPTIEISRIKQVLAYKCKEHSTALKMKQVMQQSRKESSLHIV